MIRVGHPRWIGAALAFGAAAGVLLTTDRVGWMRSADHALFETLAGAPGKVVGDGSPTSPRSIEHREAPAALPPPRVLFVDDDPDGYFEYTPPPPADLMVVLARLQQSGLRSVGFGYSLQWEKPDTLALEAMRRAMDGYDRAVLGYVVKDSTAPVPVPPPFLAASMPYSSVEGDASKLPVVNGVVGLAPEFGGERSWAGFTRIGTEEAEENRAYLLARWSDRVIFSVPLAQEIARRGLVPETDVSVRMGSEIALGPEGPRIPIDFRGRVDLPDDAATRRAAPATAVISKELADDFLTAEAPVYVTDERLLGDKANRTWAQRLPRIDAAVRGAPVVAERTRVPPWPLAASLGGCLALAIAGAWLTGLGPLPLRVLTSLLFGTAAMIATAAMIRGGAGSPPPLAVAAVPATLLLGVLFLDSIPKVEVVSSERKKRSEAGSSGESSPKKRGKRRQRRRGKKR